MYASGPLHMPVYRRVSVVLETRRPCHDYMYIVRMVGCSLYGHLGNRSSSKRDDLQVLLCVGSLATAWSEFLGENI